MPQIKPTSVEDLLQFIKDHRSDIENGVYDIVIEKDWVPEIQQDVLRFLVKKCPSVPPVLSRIEPADLLPKDILLGLARHKDWDVRAFLAENPTAPADVLDILAKHGCSGSVAGNPNTPEETFVELAKHEDVFLRDRVVHNPNTPPDVLAILARDYAPVSRPGHSSYSICEAVAEHSRTPVSALRTLSKHGVYHIRCAVARNPNTPPDVLRKLRKDPDKYVRKNAGAWWTCFVATAVYGSPSAPQVILLRNFRDTVLEKSRKGRVFISVYYAVSPSVARAIKRFPQTQSIIRCFVLNPLVRLIRKRFSL